MPEGDTLWKLARAMGPLLEGSRIEVARLHGRRVRSWERPVSRVDNVGKHLLIELAPEGELAGEVVRTHLGLHGSWHRYGPEERWRKPAWRAAIELRSGEHVLVCFDAKEVESLPAGAVPGPANGTTRSPGENAAKSARPAPRNRTLAELGPDLLENRIDVVALVARARELLPEWTPLVDVLLDQRVAAGIGNVYKNEVLFLERYHPQTPLGSLGDDGVRALFERARSLMRRNIAPDLRRRRRTTTFDRSLRGDSIDAPSLPRVRSRTWVYGRSDEPCLCCGDRLLWGRPGRRRRDTCWCPTCQPLA